MKVLTPEEMRHSEARAMADGISGHGMMVRAAEGIADEVMHRQLSGRPVLIFAGPGQNGGDGLAAGRLLHVRGMPVCVVCEAGGNRRGDGAVERQLCVDAGVPLVMAEDETVVQRLLKEAGLVVDAIFGTGFNRAPEGLWKDVILRVNQSGLPVIAADIPSGVDGRTGSTPGVAVRAETTVTFGALKAGVCLYPGRGLAGHVRVADIGIDGYLPVKPFAWLSTEEHMTALLPPLRPEDHKGSRGRVWALAGSGGMAGAAVLACRSAYRTGCGLVTACVPEAIASVLQIAVPDVVLRFRGSPEGLWPSERYQAGLAGPGLGSDSDTEAWTVPVHLPWVLDADALNALARKSWCLPEGLRGIMTPHPLEAARLLGCSVQEVERDRTGATRRLAAATGLVAVLKGASTLIAGPEGDLWINPTGNPGMAVAGMGDVLAGVCAGLLAQGCSPWDAARLGVWVHGAAGDVGAALLGMRGLMAADMPEQVAAVLKAMEARERVCQNADSVYNSR